MATASQVSERVAAQIEAEKAKLTSPSAVTIGEKLAALVGKTSGALVFGDPIVKDKVTVVPVSRRDGSGVPIPIGYIEADENAATYHHTRISDTPEYLILAALLILPIIALIFLIRALAKLASRMDA